MIEQSIYGRADNDHRNANGQAVAAGYGHLAYSPGFDALASALDRNVTSYANAMPDRSGKFPPVLAMYEVQLPNGDVHVLQQNNWITRAGRPFHVAHQYAAAGSQSIDEMIAVPLRWMQLRYQDQHQEPIDFPVTQSAKMPVSVAFNPGTLSEVLRYFSMPPAAFEMLLCSLFEVLKYERRFALVLINDARPDYFDWVKRMIVHVYNFLPFSMRRKVGFESWFTGKLASDSIKLCFAGSGNLLKDQTQRFLRMRPNSNEDVYDVTHCVLFAEGGCSCIPDPEHPMNFTRRSSYRAFIHPWLELALRSQDGGRVAAQLNQYFLLFDSTPDGRREPSLDSFQNLLYYEQIYRGAYFPELEKLPEFADAFCEGMGGAGKKLLAMRLASLRNSAALSASDFQSLAKLLDIERFGEEITRCAATLLLNSPQMPDMGAPQLLSLIQILQKSNGLTESSSFLPLIQKLRPSENCWRDIDALLTIAALENLKDDERAAALRRVIDVLPERFSPGDEAEAALQHALTLAPALRNSFVAAYLERMEPDGQWLLGHLESLMHSCQDAAVSQRCMRAVERLADGGKLRIDDAMDMMTATCLLFADANVSGLESADPEIARLLLRLVAACRLREAAEGYVRKVLDELKDELPLSQGAFEAAMGDALQNPAIPVPARIRIALDKHPAPERCAALEGFLEEQMQAEPRSLEEALELLRLRAELSDAGALSARVEELALRALRVRPFGADFLPTYAQALSALPAEFCERCVVATLEALQANTEPGTFALVRSLMTGFSLGEGAARAACAALDAALYAVRMDESALRDIEVIALRRPEFSGIYLPLWRRALSLLPTASEESLRRAPELIQMELRLSATQGEFADAVHDWLTRALLSAKLTPALADRLVREALKLPPERAAELARAAFTAIKVEEGGDVQGALALLLKLARALPEGPALDDCFRAAIPLLREGSAQLDTLAELFRCVAEDSTPDGDFARALVQCTCRRAKLQPLVDVLRLLVRNAQLDERFPDRFIEQGVRELIAGTPIQMQDVRGWIGQDDLSEQALYPAVTVELLKRVEAPSTALSDEDLDALLCCMRAGDAELSGAARAAYQRLTEAPSIHDLSFLSRELRSWGDDDCDALLARAVGALQQDALARRPRRLLEQIDRIFQWPRFSLDWPESARALRPLADELLERLAFREQLDLLEACGTDALRRKLLERLERTSAELAEIASIQELNSQRFLRSYGLLLFDVKNIAGMLLEDCRRILALYDGGREADAPICHLFECLERVKAANPGELLDQLLSLRVDLPEVPTEEAWRSRSQELCAALSKELAAPVKAEVSSAWSKSMERVIAHIAKNCPPKAFSGDEEIGKHCLAWLLALPRNGIDINGSACLALFTALGHNEIRFERYPYPLFVLLNASKGEMRRLAYNYNCEVALDRARKSHEEKRGMLSYDRLTQLVPLIQDVKMRRSVMAYCVCRIDEEKPGSLYKTCEDGWTAKREPASFNDCVFPLENKLRWEHWERITEWFSFLAELAACISSRLQRDAAANTKAELVRFCWNRMWQRFQDTNWMCQLFKQMKQKPNTDDAKLLIWTQWVFPRGPSEDNPLSTYDLRGCSNDMDVYHQLRLSDNALDACCMQYLYWRMYVFSRYCTRHILEGNREDVLNFLNIADPSDTLEGWWSLAHKVKMPKELIWKFLGKLCHDYITQKLVRLPSYPLLYPIALLDTPLPNYIAEKHIDSVMCVRSLTIAYYYKHKDFSLADDDVFRQLPERARRATVRLLEDSKVQNLIPLYRRKK